MRLMDLLQSLGDRLGVVERVAGSEASEPPEIQTRKVSLAELTAEIRADEVQALADQPTELAVPFQSIFEAAGIQPPPHGWTIEKLRQNILSNPGTAQDREATQRQILDMLQKSNASVEDLVKDATARDQALDAFEAVARKKIEDRIALRRRRLSDLQAKIAQLQGESDRLQALVNSEEQKWREWRSQKRAQERDLAWTVGFLIDRPVITTDNDENPD